MEGTQTEIVDLGNLSLDDVKVVAKEGKLEIETPTLSKSEAPKAEVTEAPKAEVTEAPKQETTQSPQEATQEAPKETSAEYKWKDDFIKKAVEYYEKTGDLTPYLQAKTVDFTAMTDEDILRRNLREQYADLSDKAFDRLYKQQVTDKYKLDADEWGEEDSQLGRELLKVEASKVRNQYMEWQKNFSAPEPEIQNDQTAEIMAQFEQEVKNSELTKSILEGKKISIKTSDGEFNYEIPQADQLVDMTLNNDKFFGLFADAQGKLDYAKWYKTAAYSQNPELFEKSLINYGKTLGRSEVTKEIKNPSTSQVADVPTESSGDFTTGLLQAFAARGIHK